MKAEIKCLRKMIGGNMPKLSTFAYDYCELS